MDKSAMATAQMRSQPPDVASPLRPTTKTTSTRPSVFPEPLRDQGSDLPPDASRGPAITGDPSPTNPLDELISSIYRPPVSLFDDVIATISESATQRAIRLGPPPPPERFRVRVATVGRPHRATKRNYDYFEELNATIAARTKTGQNNEA
jgi:hypothetical protein